MQESLLEHPQEEIIVFLILHINEPYFFFPVSISLISLSRWSITSSLLSIHLSNSILILMDNNINSVSLCLILWDTIMGFILLKCRKPRAAFFASEYAVSFFFVTFFWVFMYFMMQTNNIFS